MLKTAISKLINILLKPFREHFLFLIAFFFLATSPYFLWYRISMRIIDSYILYLIAHSFVFSYLVTLFICIVKPPFLRKTLQGILMVFAIICFGVNFYCNFELISRLDADIAMLILGTDIKESKEFASVLLPTWIVLVVIGVYLAFFTLWLISRKHPLNLRKKSSYVAMAGLCICAIMSAYNWKAWKDGPIQLFVEMASIDRIDNLQSYYTHPKIIFEEEAKMPSNVILIIGESFARSHSSLYNYEKQTNPQLRALRDSSLLFTFDSVDAPAPTTANSIRFMLSTFSKIDKTTDSKKWYEYTNIIELMQDCGFGCYWFSNQALINKHNSIARIFAEACEKQWFFQEKDNDIILVDSSYQFANHLSQKEHSFIIYHLLGSHFDYSKRYSKEFAKFTWEDYLTEPQEHRAILASYDNSIFYNDYVVSQIINLYKEKDAILIYIPDHGQVMYRDPKSPNYFAHGRLEDKTSYALGVEIPFMIFASQLFQQNHPETTQRIKKSQAQGKPWNSDDLPYLIMDLIGVKSIDGENVRPKSILN